MKIVGACVAATLLFSFLVNRETSFERKDRLSEYDFFEGRLALLNPSAEVIPYELNTPLFSNYAEKLRFIKLPENGKIGYNDSTAFEFPVGTILIKNFYFLNDFRKPAKGRRILETRLLVHEANGWQAYPYIWNDEQTDAFYDPAGETKNVTYIDAGGKTIKTPYVIPNKNQCKGCHVSNDGILPIGPSARQLNRERRDGANQLTEWSKKGILDLPSTPLPKMPVWDDDESGDLNGRARAYLDSNCGHCHSRSGPANTSGLFLDIFENNPSHLGVNKSPVAAGRGSGDLQYDIVPGRPQNSILVFRMKTNDPSIAMPEIGREQIHKEGVALIERWIRENKF